MDFDSFGSTAFGRKCVTKKPSKVLELAIFTPTTAERHEDVEGNHNAGFSRGLAGSTCFLSDFSEVCNESWHCVGMRES